MTERFTICRNKEKDYYYLTTNTEVYTDDDGEAITYDTLAEAQEALYDLNADFNNEEDANMTNLQITIKVTGTGEDEKGAGGLWDLAGEIALAVAFKREVFVEEQPYYAEEWGQEEIYNLLQEYKEVN